MLIMVKMRVHQSGYSIRAMLAKALPAMTLAALSACGGGGGGSSDGGSVTPQNFTSWGAIPASTPVTAEGLSVTVTSDGAVSSDTANSSATFVYSSSKDLLAFSFTTPTTSASWTQSSGSLIECLGDICVLINAAGDTAGVVSDPYASVNAWNYQSFGVWNVPNGSLSAMSYGAPTLASAIPVSGTATYAGSLRGGYVSAAETLNGVPVSAGSRFGLLADFSATADFGAARTVTISTANTLLERNNVVFSDPRFDLSSSVLDIADGVNLFSGIVSNGKSMSGSATGRFYGPAQPTPEELGGTVQLTGTNGEAMIGAFGAKR